MTSLSPTRCRKSDSIAFSPFLSLLFRSFPRCRLHSLRLSRALSPPRDSKAAHSSAEAAGPPDLLVLWSHLHRAGPHPSSSRLLFHIHPVVSSYFHLSRASPNRPPAPLSPSSLAASLSILSAPSLCLAQRLWEGGLAVGICEDLRFVSCVSGRETGKTGNAARSGAG